MSLLLKQQPVASDFRFVSAALKLISDLERIGDQCADIADMIRFTTSYDLKDFKDLEEIVVIPKSGHFHTFGASGKNTGLCCFNHA